VNQTNDKIRIKINKNFIRSEALQTASTRILTLYLPKLERSEVSGLEISAVGLIVKSRQARYELSKDLVNIDGKNLHYSLVGATSVTMTLLSEGNKERALLIPLIRILEVTLRNLNLDVKKFAIRS
jgi:hypothetical protein